MLLAEWILSLLPIPACAVEPVPGSPTSGVAGPCSKTETILEVGFQVASHVEEVLPQKKVTEQDKSLTKVA